jgi:hypothetical protein
MIQILFIILIWLIILGGTKFINFLSKFFFLHKYLSFNDKINYFNNDIIIKIINKLNVKIQNYIIYYLLLPILKINYIFISTISSILYKLFEKDFNELDIIKNQNLIDKENNNNNNNNLLDNLSDNSSNNSESDSSYDSSANYNKIKIIKNTPETFQPWSTHRNKKDYDDKKNILDTEPINNINLEFLTLNNAIESLDKNNNNNNKNNNNNNINDYLLEDSNINLNLEVSKEFNKNDEEIIETIRIDEIDFGNVVNNIISTEMKQEKINNIDVIEKKVNSTIRIGKKKI